MAHLKLDISSLERLAAYLTRTAEQSEMEFSRLRSRLEPSSVWEGGTPPAYQELYVQFLTAQRDLVEAQERLATLIEQIANNFDAIDAAGATALTELSTANQDGPGITVDAYLSTDDLAVAERVFDALDHLLDLIGYDPPFEFEINSGSIWRRTWVYIKDGISSQEVQVRLVKVERAIELAQIDERQADVDAKLSEAVSTLLASLADIPQACIRAGSLLVIKYTDLTGPVVLCRNLSQLEIRAIEQFPEIQRQPKDVLEALASAVSLFAIEEGS